MTAYILIIEDDPILGKVSIEAAKQIGLQAVLDENGDEYLNLIKQHGTPSLVLLDLHLPYATGATILENLRVDKQTTNVPVIITTADIIQARILEAQGEHVVLKPFSINRLQDIFSHTLNKN